MANPGLAISNCRFPPLVKGHVLEVSADGLHVTLDVGAGAGVEVGYPFDVYRGSTHCGQVRVERVEEHRCYARITSSKNPVAVGDGAATRL